ncbi:ABC transporter ATP-binding protein/permease [Gammaproteobacteria bacterium]|nr:ABC transporter ATP-binding protein/permease [Gammaproteobacteria bacterium]
MFSLGLKLLKTYPSKSVLIIILSLVVGVLEGISIGAIMPILEIILNNNFADPSSSLATFIASLLNGIGLDLTIYSVTGLLFFAILGKAVVSFFSMNVIGSVVANISNEMRKSYVDAYISSQWLYLKSLNSGEGFSSLNQEIPKAASIYRYTCVILTSIFQIFVLLYLALIISYVAVIGGIILGLLIFILLHYFIKLSRDQSTIQVGVLNSFNSNINELFKALKVFKSMNLSKSIMHLIFSESDRINSATKKQIVAKHGTSYLQEPIMMFFLCIGLSFSFSLGITPASLLVTMVIFIRTAQALGKLQSDYQTFVTNAPYYFSFSEKLQLLNDHSEGLDSHSSLKLKSPFKIIFDSVSFSYGKKIILDKVNIQFPSKGLICISGKSGSGKTSIVDLILGFYKPSEGQINILDAYGDLQTIESIRNSVGYVQQEPFIFHNSLFENITLGDNMISDESVFSALETAGCSEFVADLPNGLHTNLLEGGSILSGGQRQRLSIARALVKKPSLLLLDEFTSALDGETASLIMKTISGIGKKIPVIIITHDQKIASFADYVYTIKDCKVELS